MFISGINMTTVKSRYLVRKLVWGLDARGPIIRWRSDCRGLSLVEHEGEDEAQMRGMPAADGASALEGDGRAERACGKRAYRTVDYE